MQDTMEKTRSWEVTVTLVMQGNHEVTISAVHSEPPGEALGRLRNAIYRDNRPSEVR